MVLLKQFLLSLAKWWLGAVFGWFARKGIIESADMPTYVNAMSDWLVPVVMATVSVVWIWVSTKGRQLATERWHHLVVRAAAAPADTPLAQIEHAEKAGIPIVVVSRNVQVGKPADRCDDGPEAA